MKSVVLILALVSVTYAGVGVLTPEIEAAALRLWQEHCNGASEGGTDGNTFIYCKKSRDTLEETLQHEVQLNPGEEAKEQIVFVQPPSYHYKHDVIVSGGGIAAPKTVIYVKPAKNTHEVNVDDQTAKGVAPQKPTLYFLKGSHGEESTGIRQRRQNEPLIAPVNDNASLMLPIAEEAEAVVPKKRTVYILRRSHLQ